MTDLSQLSDQELMQLAGQQPAPQSAPQGPTGLEHLSNEEVLQLANGQQPVSAVEQSQAEQQQYDKAEANSGDFANGTEIFAKHLARSTTFGASGLAEDLNKSREQELVHPFAAAAGDIAGLLVPGAPEAKALMGAGKLALKGVSKIAPNIVGEGILAGMSRSAVKLAAENALYQVGDENAKMLMNDPESSMQNALPHIGLAAVLGGVTGGAFGAVSPLWKATVGNKASQLVADFKGRIQEHLTNPEPVEGLTRELGQYHTDIKSMADEVYGPQGLKAQEISKLMPEMSPKIQMSMEELNTKAETALQDMAKKNVPERYINKFKNELDTFQSIATKPEATPSELFNAAQTFKQELQGYSKGNFGPFAVPSYHEAYDFLNITKNLGHDIRTSLEAPETWGKAADRQLSINKAFKEYLPALKDFEKRFTTEVNGERTIDPGKISTYYKQLGKPSAEIKQTMLKNFLDASERYKQVIADTHNNLGISNPMPTSYLNAARNSLNDISHGAKLADLWVKRSPDMAGKTMGAGLGAALGHASGIPGMGWLGAVLGERVAGPFIGSVLPALSKAILEKVPSGEGLKAAAEYGAQVVKGEKLSTSAIKNLFKSGVKVLPDSMRSSEAARKKLEASLADLQKDPGKLVNISGDLAHYMPDHATALGATAQNITQFLNSIKPQTAPKSPLDSPSVVSAPVQAQYNRALDIAEQPLIVLESVKEGTINSNDIMGLQRMYPALYKGLQQKMMNEMVAQVAKGEIIPYKTRMGLSMFLNQHIDSSFNPQSIAQAQPQPEQAPQQPAGSPNSPRAGKLSQGAASGMAKGNKASQTPLQASSAMHSSDKA